MKLEEMTKLVNATKENIQKVIIGKDEVILKILTSLIAGGNVLLEDVPGTGKTLLAKSLAKSVDAAFKRIQFTPDLLPSDITGMNIYNQKESCFTFIPGPAFSNILLADEINRATPRTQSSLLECMEEKQITVDGTTYPLSQFFFVIATQNPVETAGTFPLPEAQLDRFMMQLSMGTPSVEEELNMMDRFIKDDPLSSLSSVCTKEDILAMREYCKTVFVHNSIREYIVKVIQATRNNNNIAIGVSPRGTLAFVRALQVYAAVNGRDFVLPDDVKALTLPVLEHRILTYGSTQSGNAHPLNDILANIPVPSENFQA